MVMEKEAKFRQRMAELKGITDLVVDEVKPAPSNEKLDGLKKIIEAESREQERPFQKKASRSTLDVFADLVSLVKSKLEVDDVKAREMAGTIISKSLPLQKQYGLTVNEASSKILDEMEKQLGKGQLKADRGLVSYQKQDLEIYSPIQMRIKDNFDITQGESEIYTNLIKEIVRDFSIQFRGVPPEKIANAIVSVAIKSEDITVIRGIKNSPFLEEALRMELGLC